jgi:iron(III) transport system ATP-binding protein
VTAPALRVHDLAKSHGGHLAVAGVNLELRSGEITCLLGPSGCGKSTLLRLVAGLETPDAGEIWSGERMLLGPGLSVPPERRGVGLVFQDYALFPHMTVRRNVEFGLKGFSAAERRARAEAMLRLVHLETRAEAWPHMLSGGEQQRIAIARALAPRPAILLLDEPFSGLDAHLKAEVRLSLLETLRAVNAAVLIVTHDAREALLMADKLLLMTGGEILQSGTPQDCYLAPASPAAARLLGEMNLVRASVRDGVARTAFGMLPAPGLADGEARAMIRPEGIHLALAGAPARVADARFGGGFYEVTLEAGGELARLHLPGPVPEPGSEVEVELEPGLAKVFPSAS